MSSEIEIGGSPQPESEPDNERARITRLFGSVRIGTPDAPQTIYIGLNSFDGLVVTTQAVSVDPHQFELLEHNLSGSQDVDLVDMSVERLLPVTTGLAGMEVTQAYTLGAAGEFVNITISLPDSVEGQTPHLRQTRLQLKLEDFLRLFQKNQHRVLIEFVPPEDPTQESRAALLVPNPRRQQEYVAIFFVEPRDEVDQIQGREIGSLSTANAALKGVVRSIDAMVGRSYRALLHSVRISKAYRETRHPVVRTLMELQAIATHPELPKQHYIRRLITALRVRWFQRFDPADVRALTVSSTPLLQAPASELTRGVALPDTATDAEALFAMIDRGLGGIEQQTNIDVVFAWARAIVEIAEKNEDLNVLKAAIARLERYENVGALKDMKINTMLDGTPTESVVGIVLYVEALRIREQWLQLLAVSGREDILDQLGEALGEIETQFQTTITHLWITILRQMGMTTRDPKVVENVIVRLEEYCERGYLCHTPPSMIGYYSIPQAERKLKNYELERTGRSIKDVLTQVIAELRKRLMRL